ncbi:unnamed protein product [Protopolystoma xenopodis]|uniref:Uncharacterized protein n=1 Tax=Protopolystoma xenopodis TaxID=117903 RepID=A0A3S5AQ94_9PLAT|nr:unnamed protein product [Protopolystoma xenopodis]
MTECRGSTHQIEQLFSILAPGSRSRPPGHPATLQGHSRMGRHKPSWSSIRLSGLVHWQPGRQTLASSWHSNRLFGPKL